VFSKLWASLHNRVVSAQARAVRQRARTASERAASTKPTLGTKLTGTMTRLDRLAAVWPDTVVVVFDGDKPPELRHPGEVVIPRPFPWRDPVFVLPVSTGIVTLDVIITDAITFDGHKLDRVGLRVQVRLSPADKYEMVATLAAEFRDGLAAFLLRRVQSEVTAEVEAAIRLNRLADLQRQTLEAVLADRWLPKAFAGGALTREGFEVLEVGWPQPEETTESAVENVRSALHLSVDARLQHVWKRFAQSELYGIAGAQSGGGSTVIAVPVRQPGEFQTARVREEFANMYSDPRITLVAVAADSYQGLIREWFRHVDDSPGRLVSVESVGDEEALRININDPAPADASPMGEPATEVGTESARAALRRLLPHRRVEFVGTDST
jgi:hypothetical protein